MDWPELVEVAKPLGFVECRDGHRMCPALGHHRWILGLFDGRAQVTGPLHGDWRRVDFEGEFSEVAEYLQKGAVNGSGA